MDIIKNIQFLDHGAVKSGCATYKNIDISVQLALKSWQGSLFSFEWLNQDGSIKTFDELPENEQEKRQAIEEQIELGQPLKKPILGIGIQDNIEIGSGKALFLTLAAHGMKTIPVHIPQSNEKDFKPFIKP